MSSIQPLVVPPAQTTVTCHGCEVDVDINWFCKNCSASLCDICKAQHESSKFLNKHKIVPRTGREIRILESSEIIEPCQEHPTKETTGYCTSCDVPCCISCIEEWHQGHAFVAIEKKYIECEDQLNIMVMDLRQIELQRMEHVEELRQKLSSNERMFENVKSEVKKFRQELNDTIEKSCDTLVTGLEQEQTEQRTCISDAIKTSENQIEENERFMSLCADKINKGGLDLLQFCKLPTPSHIFSESKIPEIKPMFVPARELINNIMHNVGEIRVEGRGDDMGTEESRSVESTSTSDTGKETTIEPQSALETGTDNSRRPISTYDKETEVPSTGKLKVEVPTEVENENGIGTDDSRLSETTSFSKSGKARTDEPRNDVETDKEDDRSPNEGEVLSKPLVEPPTETVKSFYIAINGSSVLPVGKDTSWVADGCSDTIQMYDNTGKELRSMTPKAGVEIWDIAMKRSRDIIVCTKDKKVRLMTANGAIFTLIDTTPFSPQGVCLTEREEIVVCMAGQGEKNHVSVYSSDCEMKIRKIVGKYHKGRQLLIDPYRVVMSGEDISVLNYAFNVVSTSQNGKVRWVYDGTQTGKVEMNAVGICVDKLLNHLISDWSNHCVHYVDRSGALIQILLTRNQYGIEHPWGIGVDWSGKVWVGSAAETKIWVLNCLI